MTVWKAINNISRYRKRYGIRIAIRALIHYANIAIKKSKINSSSNKIVEVNGYKLEVMTNDHYGTSSELLMFKSHEPVSTKLISKLLKKGMTCLDIGGNIGYYVLLENKILNGEGKIIAIEPSPDNFKQLMRNLELQKTKIVDAYNLAAGNKDGNLKFLIYEDASNSCMIIPEGQESRWPGQIIEVPVRKMDNFLEKLGVTKIEFIRMDVEGYEKHVLEGLKNTMKKSKPVIYVEVHVNIMGKENTKKFLRDLESYGYNVTHYIPRDIDVPFIGTINDVKNYNISKVLEMLDHGTLPSFLMLTLMNKNTN